MAEADEDATKKKDRWYDGCDPGCGDCDLPGCHCDVCDFFSLSTMLLFVALLAGTLAARPRGWAERAVTAAIRAYRRVSPRLPTRCRYTPTCSAYALAAIGRHGLGRGLRLAASRLVRCRPGVPIGTPDPVP